MEDFETILTCIIKNIQSSGLSQSQKADCLAQLDLGLHRLVWPILVAHISEVDLKDAVDHPESMTVTRYGELMGKAVSHPESAREIHDEVMGALGEIEGLLTKQSIPAAAELPKSPGK